MSDILSLIGDALAPYALVYQNQRMIGTIIPDVTIEEVHHDELTITDHPVETGAAISDHAFKRPPEVEMRCGFSDSTGGAVGYVQQVYDEFLSLQASREPFDVYTGKRAYTDMLVRSLSVVTDESSEYALMVVVGLRNIILTDTIQSATPQSAQALPQQTASTVNRGTAQANPATGNVAPLL